MRKKYEWNVTLQREDGQIVDRKVRAYWDPEQEGCSEAVAVTAAAEAWWEGKKAYSFAPIAASLVS